MNSHEVQHCCYYQILFLMRKTILTFWLKTCSLGKNSKNIKWMCVVVLSENDRLLYEREQGLVLQFRSVILTFSQICDLVWCSKGLMAWVAICYNFQIINNKKIMSATNSHHFLKINCVRAWTSFQFYALGVFQVFELSDICPIFEHWFTSFF